MGKTMAARNMKSLAWGLPKFNDVQWRREVRGWMCHKCKELEGGEWRICHLTCNMH